MSACEKCWADASMAAHFRGGEIIDHYYRLLDERKGDPCTPDEQRGQSTGVSKRWPWKLAFYTYVYAGVSFCIALLLTLLSPERFPFWQVWVVSAGLIAAVVMGLATAGSVLFALGCALEYLHDKAFGRGEG